VGPVTSPIDCCTTRNHPFNGSAIDAGRGADGGRVEVGKGPRRLVRGGHLEQKGSTSIPLHCDKGVVPSARNYLAGMTTGMASSSPISVRVGRAVEFS